MKPPIMDVKISSIPMELRQQPKWICWKWEERKGKMTKPLYNFKTNQYAKSNDPTTWGDFMSAYKAYKTGKYDGVGFVLTEDDNYAGIDWDDCLSDGNILNGVRDEILRINSYTEISPSGNGMKTLIKGKLPGKGHHSKTLGVFDQLRYFCITGHIYKEVSGEIEKRQDELNALYKKNWGDEIKKPNRQNNLDTTDIIQKAITANDGGKFARLWYGEISEYPSASEADLALCTKLAFWVNGDFEKIDSLFRQSGLMREKWERDDYRNNTIDRACNTQNEGYTGQNGQYGQDGQYGYESGLPDKERTKNGQTADNYRTTTDNYRTTTGQDGPTKMSLKSALKAWILLDKRQFRIQDAYNDLDIKNRQQKKTVSDYLSKFCDEGLLERVNGQRGVFLYKESECSYIDYINIDSANTVEHILTLPLGLEDLGIQVMPGNIIVVAGESNSGKTSLLMNIVHDNLKTLNPTGKYNTIKYFSSEMGPQEMHTRVKAFGDSLSLWKGMKAIERTSSFHQVLDPDGLNIIDFMEVHNEFYIVGEWIRKIYESLNNGICVIALQKKAGTDFGRSGEISLEKPRLYLSISEVIKGYSSCKIVKAKNYVGERNPNGLEKDFRITKRGSYLQELTEWRYVQYAERKKINAEYELLVQQEATEFEERRIPGDETAFDFFVDGDKKRLTVRQVQQWRKSFTGLDVDTVLSELSYDSFEKPFLSSKNWFWQVSGILGKKYKQYKGE